MSDAEQKAKIVYETLADGVSLPVKLLDKGGQLDTVTIRRLPPRKIPTLGKAWGDEDKEIMVYCDRDATWLENLDHEQWAFIVNEGRRLNGPPFLAWMARQRAALKAMSPDALENGEAMAKEIIRSEMVQAIKRRTDTPTPTPS